MQICCFSPCYQFHFSEKQPWESLLSLPMFLSQHGSETWTCWENLWQNMRRVKQGRWILYRMPCQYGSLCGWPTSDDPASVSFSFLDCRMTPELPSTSKSCMILWRKHLVTAIFFEAQELFLLNFAFPALSLKADIELMARQVSCWSTVLGSKQATISPMQFWTPKALNGCLKISLMQIYLPEKLELNCCEAV